MDKQPERLEFDQVYEQYADPVYRYCFRLCNGHVAEAEDVAQETFVEAYRDLESLREPSAVQGWLFSIAYHRWRRRGRSPLRTVEMSSTPGSHEISDPRGEISIDRLVLEQCLAQLPEAQRMALILVKMEGYTSREAAVILRRPQGTVQFQVAQALRRLKRLLVDQGAIAAGVPLELLGRTLPRWGELSAPPTLHPRVLAALTAAAANSGGAARRRHRSGAGVAGSRRQPVLAVAATALLMLVLLRWGRRSRPDSGSPQPLPSRVAAAARATQTLHVTGSSVEWLDNGRMQVLPQRRVYEAWYEAPDRFRIELTPLAGRSGPRTFYVIRGGEARTIMPDIGRRALRVLNTPVSAVGPLAALTFLRSDSPLFQALSDPDRPPEVFAEDGVGNPLRLINVEVRRPSSVDSWFLHVEPNTARLQQVDYRWFGLGTRGLQLRQELTLARFDYDVPVPADKLELPQLP